MSYEDRAKYELETVEQGAESAAYVPQEIVLENCTQF